MAIHLETVEYEPPDSDTEELEEEEEDDDEDETGMWQKREKLFSITEQFISCLMPQKNRTVVHISLCRNLFWTLAYNSN